MVTLDTEGVAFVEETDAVSPLHTLLNALQQATSDVFAALPGLPTVTSTQRFTVSGTWTKPAGARAVQVRCVGGGGGGGGCPASAASQSSAGAGGGGGEYAETWFDAATLGATVAVAIGAGGTVASGSAGGTGGDTTFGATAVVAKGGSGGAVRASSASMYSSALPGTGGTGGTGDVLIPGDDGGLMLTTGLFGMGGAGGGSVLGSSVAARSTGSPVSYAGVAGKQYGSGGSGAVSSNGSAANAGGAGSAGVLIVTTYF